MVTLILIQQITALKLLRADIIKCKDETQLKRLIGRLRVDVYLIECEPNSLVEAAKYNTTDQLSYIISQPDYTKATIINTLDPLLLKVELLGFICEN